MKKHLKNTREIEEVSLEAIILAAIRLERERIIKGIERLKHEYVLAKDQDNYNCMDCSLPAEDCLVNVELDRAISMIRKELENG